MGCKRVRNWQVPDRDAHIKQDSEDPTPDAEIRTREFDALGQEVLKMCSGSEEGSYVRLIDVCITQL